MKDVVLLAASVYLLKQDILHAAANERTFSMAAGRPQAAR
jgi:hypothetical protein